MQGVLKQTQSQAHTYLEIRPERYFSEASDFRWTLAERNTWVHFSRFEGVSVKSAFSLLETVQL